MAETKHLGTTAPTAWGAWSAAANYPKLSVVRHGGKSYMAIIANSGVQPGVTTGWSTAWMLLNEDGQDGAPGAPGQDGEGVPPHSSGDTGKVLGIPEDGSGNPTWIFPKYLEFLDTAPTADNPNSGCLGIVFLQNEPAHKYRGYIYFIAEVI